MALLPSERPATRRSVRFVVVHAGARSGSTRAGGDLRKQSFEPVLPRTSAPWYGRELVVPAKSGHRSVGKAAVQRLSSATFEATPVFAVAKMGGGSNVRCNDLLGGICTGIGLASTSSQLLHWFFQP
jgi:hypothetical protein